MPAAAGALIQTAPSTIEAAVSEAAQMLQLWPWRDIMLDKEFTDAERPKLPSRVQLAVSPIGSLAGATAYHTSVLVDGEEFSFSDVGVDRQYGPASHFACETTPRVLHLGTSVYSGDHLITALGPHFLPGTYDLCKKNCNSFTDCALSFLLERRLGSEFRALETVGSWAPFLAEVVSGGQYSLNKRSAHFDLEELIRDVSAEKKDARAAEAEETKAANERAERIARMPGGAGAGTAAWAAGWEGLDGEEIKPPQKKVVDDPLGSEVFLVNDLRDVADEISDEQWGLGGCLSKGVATLDRGLLGACYGDGVPKGISPRRQKVH